VAAPPAAQSSLRPAAAGPRAARLAVPPPSAPTLAKSLATSSPTPQFDLTRAPAERSARAAGPDHSHKHGARHRAKGDSVPPASPVPPGGAGQAAASAAGGGGAAPELPGILIVILAASGLPALQRHRIALLLQTPTACARPLERPG
jgi:hypothetical protein